MTSLSLSPVGVCARLGAIALDAYKTGHRCSVPGFVGEALLMLLLLLLLVLLLLLLVLLLFCFSFLKSWFRQA